MLSMQCLSLNSPPSLLSNQKSNAASSSRLYGIRFPAVRCASACIDLGIPYFDIRCSEILNFNKGGLRTAPENNEKFVTLLS